MDSKGSCLVICKHVKEILSLSIITLATTTMPTDDAALLRLLMACTTKKPTVTFFSGVPKRREMKIEYPRQTWLPGRRKGMWVCVETGRKRWDSAEDFNRFYNS